MSPGGESLSAEVLSRILLIQNVAGQLPTQERFFEFVCRGLADLPGVAAAWRGDPPTDAPIETVTIPLREGDPGLGALSLGLEDRSLFAPYEALVRNLVVMLGFILVDRRRRDRDRRVAQELERRVAERTAELSAEVRERMAAEQTARRQQQRAEHFLRISEAMIVQLDAVGRVEVINERGAEVLGRSIDEIVGRDWFELAIPAAVRDEMRAVFGRIMAGESSAVEYFENSLVTADGEVRYIAWHNIPLRSPEGALTGSLSSGVDVTERRRAEEELAAETELLGVTLRSIAEGVITADAGGNVVMLNRSAEILVGCPAGEAMGKGVSDLLDITGSNGGRPCGDLVGQVVDSGSAVVCGDGLFLQSRDGTVRAVSVGGYPIKDPSGTVSGLVAVIRDRTEEYHLLAASQRADKLDSLGVLAGGIAHDFNNLLAGLFGYLDLARSDLPAGSDVRAQLDSGLSLLDRARDLTRQLLTFAKGNEPSRSITPLGDVIRESVEFAASGSNVAVDLRIPAGLWPCDVDRNLMGQVFDNLTLNAIQAMPRGGTLVVAAGNEDPADDPHGPAASGSDTPRVHIAFRDSGVGIAPEIRERVFDPFFTTKETGTGLGLATCYSIVNQHRGVLDLESTPGAGCTVHVRLPAVPGAEPVSAIRETPDGLRGSGLVIVMDDQEELLTVTRRMLQKMGFAVATARSGEEALAEFVAAVGRNDHPVAVLADLTVPGGMGGVEMAAALRRLDPDVQVVAMSGYSEDRALSRPGEFGFVGAIAKPFTRSELAVELGRRLLRPDVDG